MKDLINTTQYIIQHAIPDRLERIQSISKVHTTHKKRALDNGSVLCNSTVPTDLYTLEDITKDEAGHLLNYANTLKAWCRYETLQSSSDQPDEDERIGLWCKDGGSGDQRAFRILDEWHDERVKSWECRLLKAHIERLQLDGENIERDWIRRDIENALHADYENVARMITVEADGGLQPPPPVMIDKEESDALIRTITHNRADVNRLKIANIQQREILSDRVKQYFEIVVDILDTMQRIMEKYNDRYEQEKNKAFDTYQSTLTDALILKIKTLHVTVLNTTYSKNLVSSLQMLRSLLESQSQDTHGRLSAIEHQLQEYQDLGPEFETLRAAYERLLKDIQTTEDDIRRITNG
ncbi:hypothetical protein DFQ29_003443 [Apophysomyces sp. BC1021]|nr:hypothetical protein DFQ29_003443 [Apophysomyces sp. BC1021]